MKDTKTNTPSPEMLGAISQAKQIHAQLSRSGVPVPAVNPESVKDGGLLYEYLNAIHEAVVRKGLAASGTQASPPSSPSVPSGLPANADTLLEVIRRAVMDSEKEREDYIVKNGGFSYAQLYNRYLEVKKANGSQLAGFSAEFHTIINQYHEIIERMNAGEFEKYNKDQSLSESVDKLTEELSPVIEANSISFWTFVRRRLAGWKKQSRWRNPYTYMYFFIGLMLSFVMVFAIHTNHQLRTTIGEVRRENLEYHIVDAYMSRSPEYVEDRTAIHESIETNGLDSTWRSLWNQEQE